MNEKQLIEQANEIFEKLGLMNLKDYAQFKGIKPPSVYNSLHQKNVVTIGNMNFYKTKEV